MTLAERIESDYVAAYKAKDAVRLSVLRLLKTAVKNLLVERRQQPLEEGDLLDLIARQCKQRQDSIDQYAAAGREDLADKEREELVVLREYMPEQISGDALTDLIKEVIAQKGASSVKDMGMVMQELTAGHKGRYDGKEASGIVRALLAGS